MRKESFGKMPDGREISLYFLENDRIRAAVTDLGAVLVRLMVPDRDGKMGDIVLGYDTGEEYLENPHCLGATVLPVANRTKDASVVLDGKEYHLPANEGPNNLHSDKTSFVTLWEVLREEEDSVTFVHRRADLEDGLPGDRCFETTYSLVPDGLRIDFYVTTTRPTCLNPVNHSYFNLTGDGSGQVYDQILRLHAAAFTPLGEGQIPTGEIRPVEGSPFDFREGKPIGREIGDKDPQLLLASGYDHNFVIDGYTGDGSLLPVAEVRDPASGRVMEVSSTQPGVQLYTANFTDVENGKKGAHYRPRGAFCLETQFFPDSLHHAHFPQPVFDAGTPLHAVTVFRFPASLCK